MESITRRRLLKAGLGGGALATMPCRAWPPAASTSHHASSLRGPWLRRFVQPLPVPGEGIVVAQPSTAQGSAYAFTQRPIARQLHPDLPATPFWAYDDGSGLEAQAGSFGMLVVARNGVPLTMSFTNALPPSYPSWIPVDSRLTYRPTNDVRVLTHLHGGFVGADSDGNPAITPQGFTAGQTQTVLYPNAFPQQPASLLWFHDHGLGTTRLNVFAGLAAGYLIRDEFDTGLPDNANGLPAGPYEVPLVIQDRMFGADGAFFYPRSELPGTTWIGEYFGDTMLVNGKVWPYLDVEPRLYRFRILNGCNARILTLDLGGPPSWQIGAEGGLFDVPVPMRRLVLAPAERADVLVDFSAFADTRLPLFNLPAHRPVSNPAPPLATVMQFRVAPRTPSFADASAIPAALLGGRKATLPAPSTTRWITLNEVAPETSEWTLNMNGVPFHAGAAPEATRAGEVEDWVYVNLTEDTHPMHTHLVMFQVVDRTPFDADGYQLAYGGEQDVPGGIDARAFATGPAEPPAPEERGWKDTVKADPGYLTRIRARFELPPGAAAPQTYVHHCHIVEHEDNDMMQAFTVT